MKATVITHRADFDGKFSEAIAKKYFGDNAHYTGWDYGDPVPEVDPDYGLVMIDINVDALMGHKDLIWIDHHKTAIEKYSADIAGVRTDGVAACRLAYQWFFGPKLYSKFPKDAYVNREVTEPLAVRLVGEYDIWDKRDPRSELFQHGLRSRELTADIWDRLLTLGPEGMYITLQLLEAGKAIEYYVKSQNAEIIHNIGFDLDFEGRKFLALNTARYNSLNFEAGLRPDHDGCLGFKWVGDKWSVSMYGVPGKPDIDFSAIAQKWGGGGHARACGFTAKSLPWLEVK